MGMMSSRDHACSAMTGPPLGDVALKSERERVLFAVPSRAADPEELARPAANVDGADDPWGASLSTPPGKDHGP